MWCVSNTLKCPSHWNSRRLWTWNLEWCETIPVFNWSDFVTSRLYLKIALPFHCSRKMPNGFVLSTNFIKIVGILDGSIRSAAMWLSIMYRVLIAVIHRICSLSIVSGVSETFPVDLIVRFQLFLKEIRGWLDNQTTYWFIRSHLEFQTIGQKRSGLSYSRYIDGHSSGQFGGPVLRRAFNRFAFSLRNTVALPFGALHGSPCRIPGLIFRFHFIYMVCEVIKESDSISGAFGRTLKGAVWLANSHSGPSGYVCKWITTGEYQPSIRNGTD